MRHFTTDVSTFVEVTGTKPKMVGEYSDRQPLTDTETFRKWSHLSSNERNGVPGVESKYIELELELEWRGKSKGVSHQD